MIDESDKSIVGILGEIENFQKIFDFQNRNRKKIVRKCFSIFEMIFLWIFKNFDVL